MSFPFLYPLKTSENQRFSDVSREYRDGSSAHNGLIQILLQFILISLQIKDYHLNKLWIMDYLTKKIIWINGLNNIHWFYAILVIRLGVALLHLPGSIT